MVVNKRWNIGESEYLLTQNLNKNTITVYSTEFSKEKVPTLFHAYKIIFEYIGSFKVVSQDGIINITDDKMDIDINMFDYNVLIALEGETIKSLTNLTNLYQCFDIALSMLEDY